MKIPCIASVHCRREHLCKQDFRYYNLDTFQAFIACEIVHRYLFIAVESRLAFVA